MNKKKQYPKRKKVNIFFIMRTNSLYGCGLIALYTIDFIFDVIKDPKEPDNGSEKNVVFGIELFVS